MGKCWHLPDFVLILGSLSFYTIIEAEKMPELPPLPPQQLKSGYLFTMPQTLQAGAEEQFCLTLHGIVDDQVMTLSFHAVDFALDAEYSHTYVNGVGQCNTFFVPKKPGRYEVTLSNATDVITNTVEIEVLGNNLITFVQTDKPIYKPGQKVKFRILTMMRNLRSRTGKIDNVFIIDPNNFRVKQFKAVESQGMANLEFQLVTEPKLGIWTIEVTVDEQITLQTFTVEEYVLPRFEVVITPPRYILSTSEEFEVSVCAKYTYGKPVKGFLTMVICMRGYSSYDQPCALRREEINGCYQSLINASEVMTGRIYYGGNTLTIQATVREAETGVEVNSSSEGPHLSHDPLKITMTDYTNGYFKPSLPVYGMVKVQNPDGSPAVNTDILITANDYKNDLYLAKTMTTNEDGEIVYSICQGIMENTSSLNLMAKAENYSGGEYNSPPTGYGSMKQWFSPSLSYIQIPTIHNKVKCGENLQLNVPYTHSGSEPYIKFYYQVVSRGRIVYTGETISPTFSNALDILEMNVNNCLQPSRPPTYTPPVLEPEPDLKVELSSNTSKISTDQETNSDSDEIEKDEDLSKSQESRSNSSEIDPNWEYESDVEVEDDLPANEPADFNASHRQSNLSLSSENPDSEIRRKRSDMYYRHHEREQEIVRSEPISNQVSALELQIPIIAEMSPKFSLLLYYIRDDGETVADSMDFEVEQCFDNDVQMNFSDEMVLPGAETTLTLQAAPGSVCGIGMVDKSVNILGGDHQITPEKVFQKLAKYSHSSRGRYNFYQDDRDYCKQKLESKQKEKDTNSSEDDGDFPVFDHYYWYSSSYVDAIEAFKQMGLMVFTNLVLETRPCSVSQPVYYARSFDNVALPALEKSHFMQNSANSVRSYFPETWLWDIETVGDSGTLELKKTLPHTITKWVGNSMCIDDKSGFGLSPVIGITVFQPFFLAFNLPYAAVRGERIPITITVFNYLDKCIHMLLTLDTMKNFHSFAENKNSLCLCGGQTHTRKYYITALEIGTLPISARAEIIPGMCSNEALMDTKYLGLTDAVQRQVLVKAEGVTQQYSHSVYMCAEGSQPEMEVIHLPLPDDIVPDSARGDIGVIGDIMGPALTNLDGLVRMPTGCGEQNMVGFTPNIYVLKYLTATNRLTEEIQDKAVNFMETGYQRELKYRHRDGSFSAFGEEGRKAGSSWLTAFVVKSFAQAQPFIFIDSSDLNISISYLKSVQMENGCFMERGQVLSSYMQGGLGSQEKDNVHNDAALSAYILIALLEAGLSRKDIVAVSAIECINNELQLNPDTDTYTLALAAYVNTLYNASSQQSIDIMKELNERAVSDGNVRYWKRAGEQPKPVNSWYYIAAMSAEVEMTAYALLATLQFYDEEAITNSQPTAFWLSNQQSSSGGFSSTQDTVVGLNALSEFAGVAFSDAPTDLVVRVTGGGIEHNFEVTADNSLQLQKEQLVEMRNATLHATATGTGCALLQANVRYNKVPVNLGIDNPKFILKVEPRRYRYDTNRCDRRTLLISFSIRDQTDFPSGMTLITVRMVTSWYVVPDSLKELRSKFPLLGIQKFEVDEKGLINFYFDQLDVRIRKFELDVEQNRDLAVSAPKPAEIQIYQYYEKDVTVIQTYTLKTTCGTKAEIPDNLPPDNDDDLFPAQRRENLDSLPILGLGTIPVAKVHGCPICTYNTTPQDFAALVCKSTAALKAHSGRKANYLEIKADLRPHVKVQYNKKFVTVNLDEGCVCDLLQPPAHTVIILTKSSNFNNMTLTTDDTTHIFDLKMDKNLERKARGAQRMCKLP